MNKKIGIFALFVLLGLSLFACDVQSTTPTTTTSAAAIPTNEIAAAKDETIYIEANPDGSVSSMVAVNRLAKVERGLYVDRGRFVDALDLSGASTILIQDDRLLLPILEDQEEYYYRATLANGYEAPFVVSVQYLVDGVEALHTDIQSAMKSHAIRIHVEANALAEEAFRTGYLCALQVSLQSGGIQSLEANGGLVVLAGGQYQISLSVLPGSTADFEITYEAVEFGIQSIQGTFTRFDPSFLGSELSGMAASMPLLVEGIDQLALGTDQLRQGLTELSIAVNALSLGSSDLNDGILQLKNGLIVAANAARQTESALITLAQTAAALAQGEDGIVQAYEGLLTQILDVQTTFSALHSDDMALLTKLATMAGTAQAIESALNDHLDGMTAFVEGLTQLSVGYGAFADGLDDLVAAATMLEGGASDLSSGLSLVDQAMSLLPDQVNELTLALSAISEGFDGALDSITVLFLEQNDRSSFVSSQNPNPLSTQFIITLKF